MEFTAKQIAEILNGTVEGDTDVKVNRLAKIEEGEPGALSFLANPKYEEYIYRTASSIILVNKDFFPLTPLRTTLIRVENAYDCFVRLLEAVGKSTRKAGIETPSFIHPSATIGENVYIGAFAYVAENAVIADDVQIYPHCFVGESAEIGAASVIHPGVKIYAHCKIGKSCTIHSGTVIGSDGFGFAPQENSHYRKIPQIGNVIVEDYVEIGANTTIDRATLGSTYIRKGVKLDNLIQIAHNADVGEHTVIAAQAGVAGSTKIGKYCMIGGQVGIIGHLSIADKTKIAAQSGIGANILREDTTVQGSPAFDIVSYRKSYVLFKRLPDLDKRVSQMEKLLNERATR